MLAICLFVCLGLGVYMPLTIYLIPTYMYQTGLTLENAHILQRLFEGFK